MHISKLRIKNFKCFEDVEIEFDPNFNLVIGENNSGKSTMFEAMRLWQLASHQFYMARTRKRQDGKYGFYRKFEFQPFLQNDLSFLRIDDLNNILFNKANRSIAERHFSLDDEYKIFTIELVFRNGENESSIPISFKPSSRNTLYCRLDVKNEDELQKMSDSLFDVMEIERNDTFRNRIRLAYIPPKFNLPHSEILLSEKNFNINDKLVLGQSQLVIRNILHSWCEFNYQKITKEVEEAKIKNSKKKLKTIEINELKFESAFIDIIKPYIENVLGYNLSLKRNQKSPYLIKIETGLLEILNQKFSFKSFNNPIRDSNLQIKNEVDYTEISQLGSGTINVLNILAVLSYNEQTIEKAAMKCNILLLDEPDSHLHFNLQLSLLNYLRKESEERNKQIFVITHNSSLISQFNSVLFISNKTKHVKPITILEYLENHLKDIDNNHYDVIKQLNKSKSDNDILQNQLKEITKPTLFCEGSTDVTILKRAFEVLYSKADFFNNKLDILDGNSENSVANKLIHNTKSDLIIIGLLDNDYAGKDQKRQLENKHGFIPITEGVHYVKEVKLDNNTPNIKTNTHLLLLPVPIHRQKTAKYFEDNLFIEYLFTDDVLENKLGLELYTELGNSFKQIKTSSDKKNSFKVDSNEKAKVIKNLNKLSKKDFSPFELLFEKIAEIIGLEWPKVDIDA